MLVENLVVMDECWDRLGLFDEEEENKVNGTRKKELKEEEKKELGPRAFVHVYM